MNVGYLEDHRMVYRPFDGLPNQVMLMIFQYLAAAMSEEPSNLRILLPFNVSTVSRRWRLQSLATPDLWSSVYLPKAELPSTKDKANTLGDEVYVHPIDFKASASNRVKGPAADRILQEGTTSIQSVCMAEMKDIPVCVMMRLTFSRSRDFNISAAYVDDRRSRITLWSHRPYTVSCLDPDPASRVAEADYLCDLNLGRFQPDCPSHLTCEKPSRGCLEPERLVFPSCFVAADRV